MKKGYIETLTIICKYAGIPHAIQKAKKHGFSDDDIIKRRIDPVTYEITATKRI